MIHRFHYAWRREKLLQDIFQEKGVAVLLFRVYISLRAAFNPRYFD